MFITRTLPLSLGVAVALLPLQVLGAAQTSISIEQLTPDTQGTWHILAADGSSWSTDDAIDLARHSFSITDFMPLTLSATAPAGMSAKILIYRNGDYVLSTTTPQYSFTPLPNETYRFLIQYAYSQLGSVGVTSVPSRVRFRMTGPTRRRLSGLTPRTFTNIPAGSYTIRFASTKECLSPAPHTVAVEPGVRSTVNATLACLDAEDTSIVRDRISKRSIVESVYERERKPIGQRK